MALQKQFQKGEDLIFTLNNANGFDLNTVYPASGEPTAQFVVHIYPDGMDLSLDVNRKKVQVIRYDKKSREVGTGFQGYVNPVNTGTSSNPDITAVDCILPWQLTKDMETGAHTMTIIWQEGEHRTIMIQNNIILMIDGSGEYTNGNMDIETE